MSDPVPYPPLDAELARNLMVDGQLRPNKVTDRRILDAMRTLPREAFVPPGKASRAYIDDDLLLTAKRVLMRPLVLARLVQLARPHPGETALIVGSGTGYAAALLAACGVQVIALEEDATLIAIARAALTAAPHDRTGSISIVEGKLADGHAAAAPYDLILIEGAVRAIPPVIGRQVAATGRLVAVIASAAGSSVAVLAEPSTGGLRMQPAFDANTALLPELLPAPSFTF